MATGDPIAFGACYGHSSHCTCGRPPAQSTPNLASRPAPLDERHIDIIARRVVEMLGEQPRLYHYRPLGFIAGRCIHLCTSMANDAGVAECFDCGATVQR